MIDDCSAWFPASPGSICGIVALCFFFDEEPSGTESKSSIGNGSSSEKERIWPVMMLAGMCDELVGEHYPATAHDVQQDNQMTSCAPNEVT